MDGKDLQTLLNTFGCSLVVDGIAGANTYFAIQQLGPISYQLFASKIRIKFGCEYYALEGDMGFQRFKIRYVSADEILKDIGMACQSLSIPQYTETFAQVLYYEAVRKIIKGEQYYDVWSYTPGSSYRGLGQFDKGTWDTVRAWGRSNGGIDIDSYENGVFQPGNSILAIILYALKNSVVIKRAGLPVTAATLYAAHQQGAGWVTGSRVLRNKQSADSVQFMLNNVPGMTIAPGLIEFYRSQGVNV